MQRRTLLLTCAAALTACASRVRRSPSARMRVAITMDDPNLELTPRYAPLERTYALLELLARRRVQVMLFVCGKRVDSPEGAAVLRAFDDAGHLLANHSYSHLNYHDGAITPAQFADDFARCSPIVRSHRGYRPYFRFPYLKEGDTADKRDALRCVLRERGHRNGHVSVDASDWAYDRKLRERLAADPGRELAPFREAYLKHMLDRARYYEALARATLKRPIAHTLLVHHNLLNSLFLGDLIDALRACGCDLIGPDEAYADPVYDREPALLPAGESLVWSLSRSDPQLRARLRYPAESDEYEADVLRQL